MNGPPGFKLDRKPPRNYGIALFTAVSGLLVSLLLYGIAERTENRYLRSHFSNNAENQLSSIEDRLDENARILGALRDLVQRSTEYGETTSKELDQAFRATLHGAVWLGFLPAEDERVPDRYPFERFSNRERAKWLEGTLQAMRSGRDVTMALVRTMPGSVKSGVDNAGSSSDEGEGKTAYLCYFFPVTRKPDRLKFGRGSENRQGIGAIIDLAALTSRVKSSVSLQGIDIWWFDTSEPNKAVPFHVDSSRCRYTMECLPPSLANSEQTGLTRRTTLSLGDREYELLAVAVPEFVERNRSRLPLGVFGSSLLFTVLLTVLLQSNVNREAVLEEMTVERTRAIEESRRRMLAILDSLQCGVFLIDAKTETIVEANPAALSLVGASESEVAGSNYLEYLVSYQDSSTAGGDYSQSCSLRTLSGKLIPIYNSAVGTVIGGRRYLVDNFVDVRSMLGAERTLSRILERQREVFESVAEGVLLVRENGTVIECNTAAGRLHGRTRDDMLARACDELYRSYRGRVPIQEEWNEILGEKTHGCVVVQSLRSAGPPIGTRLCVNRCEQSNMRCWLLVERPMVEGGDAEVADGKGHGKTSVESGASDIVWFADVSIDEKAEGAEWRFDTLNRAGEEVLECSTEEFALRDVEHVFTKDSGNAVCGRLASIFETDEVDQVAFEKGIRLSLGYLNKVGEVVECVTELSVLARVNESTVRVLGVAKRKSSEDESEYRFSVGDFRAITDSTLDGVVVVGPDGRPAHWNRAAEEIFGYRYEEIKNRIIHDVLTPERYRAAAKKGFSAFLKTGTGPLVGKLYRTSGLRKDGTEFPMEICLSAFRQKGRWWASAFVRDVTDRELAERELQEYAAAMEAANQNLEKLHREAMAAAEAKSAFLANMSHEIRTPINGVLGMTRLLLDTDLGAEQLDYALAVLHSADSLLTIVNDILDFSKIEAGQLDLESVDFDLREVLDTTIDIVAVKAREKHLDLTVAVDPDVPRRLRGDSGRLRQVLLNLMNNAIKFTAEGEVRTRVRVDELRESHVMLRFDISDTGIGIAGDMKKKLFEPFTQADASTTRKYGGTGLGLSICRSLVELMGGAIHCESRLGEGSTFSFTALFDIQERVGESHEEDGGDLQNVRILIVEENATMRRLLNELLTGWGCVCEETASGDEAMRLLSRSVSSNQPFQIAIIDTASDEGIGAELGLRIRADAKNERTALVMVTSLGEAEDIRRCEELGFSAFLTKPIRERMVLECVRRLICREPAQTAVRKRMLGADAPTMKDGEKAKILLAEDNPTNQKVAARLLEKLGYRVVVVEDGQAAVDSLSTDDFDLVLMDIQMPRLDGIEATRMIRGEKTNVRNPLIPIIALSAHAMKGDKEQCLAAGMDDYISKPVQPEVLSETVGRLLVERGTETNEKKKMSDSLVRQKRSDDAKEKGNSASRTPTERASERASDRATKSGSAPVDVDRLLEACDQDVDLTGEVIALFLETSQSQREQIRAAVGVGDSERLEKAAHKLKGNLLTVAADVAAEAASRLEVMGRNAEMADAAGALAVLEARLDEVVNALRAAPLGGTA